MDFVDNQGKRIGSLDVVVSNDKVITVNRIRDVTTLTIRDSNSGQSSTETFVGNLPFGK